MSRDDISLVDVKATSATIAWFDPFANFFLFQPNFSTQEEADPNSAKWPDYYVERITTLTKSPTFNSPDIGGGDQVREHPLDHLIESLKTALRTQPNSFVTRFIELQVRALMPLYMPKQGQVGQRCVLFEWMFLWMNVLMNECFFMNECHLWMNVIYEWMNDLMNELLNVCYFFC